MNMAHVCWNMGDMWKLNEGFQFGLPSFVGSVFFSSVVVFFRHFLSKFCTSCLTGLSLILDVLLERDNLPESLNQTGNSAR